MVLGGTGYVAGELLRLLAGHPHLAVAAVLSDSQAGGAVEAAFPQLAGCYPGLAFASREEMERGSARRRARGRCSAPLPTAPRRPSSTRS